MKNEAERLWKKVLKIKCSGPMKSFLIKNQSRAKLIIVPREYANGSINTSVPGISETFRIDSIKYRKLGLCLKMYKNRKENKTIESEAKRLIKRGRRVFPLA